MDKYKLTINKQYQQIENLNDQLDNLDEQVEEFLFLLQSTFHKLDVYQSKIAFYRTILLLNIFLISILILIIVNNSILI
jgi:dsDNA-specific endonuclease/ATPase MutS2